MKKTVLLLIVIFLIFGASAEINVVVTDFPCYDLARAVFGSDENITLLVKPGIDVHSYEPTPKDISTVISADMFIYIGGESDEWVEDIAEETTGKTVKLIDCVTPELEFGEEDEYDEHIWTAPENAVKMVETIKDALVECDPENADVYNTNAAAYIDEINAIDSRIKDIVANAKRKQIVFGDRFPFLYLAKAYGLDWYAAFPGCVSQSEPSAKVMGELIDAVVSNGIPVIYKIELSNGNVAATIAEETGAEVLTLHSIQNVTLEEFENGENYISIMERNIEALEKGLN